MEGHQLLFALEASLSKKIKDTPDLCRVRPYIQRRGRTFNAQRGEQLYQRLNFVQVLIRRRLGKGNVRKRGAGGLFLYIPDPQPCACKEGIPGKVLRVCGRTADGRVNALCPYLPEDLEIGERRAQARPAGMPALVVYVHAVQVRVALQYVGII